jgi:uncharacterized protein YyaL (SSP411 family)
MDKPTIEFTAITAADNDYCLVMHEDQAEHMAESILERIKNARDRRNSEYQARLDAMAMHIVNGNKINAIKEMRGFLNQNPNSLKLCKDLIEMITDRIPEAHRNQRHGHSTHSNREPTLGDILHGAIRRYHSNS